MSLTWKLRRLSAMSGREIGYRVRQQMQAGWEQLGFHGPTPPLPHVKAEGRAWVSVRPSQFDIATYRRAADEILAGRFAVFALPSVQLGFPPDWNRDPKSGTRAPLLFGKSINYRDEARVGDIKYLWEPSRHAQLVALAQAWHLSRDIRYARGCKTLLDSWFGQCPYPLGVHWTSSLEHSIRLLNWSFAWRLLGADESPLFQGAEGAEFRQRWLTNVYRHCHFIAGHFSRYSSANNHLLGELTGLFVASVTWPLWKRSARWRQSAQRELEREALRQNAADGVNKEQANWYHHEVADMMLIAGLVARANGHDFGAGYWNRLRAMLEYVASIMDVGGNVPNFGDADDAIIARLDPRPGIDVYRSLLATGAVVFDCAAFKAKAGAFDDKSRWLLGDAAAGSFDKLDATSAGLPMRRDFPDAGYYVLGDRFETDREVRIVADAGPLGYLSIAAHGHADALSFTLSAAGKELLIDPGTYAYHTQKRWRDYFRGTSAHNTVRVDRQDQSVGGGNFLWIKHAAARATAVERTEQTERWVAEHDGYTRLEDPVTHRRELQFHKDSSRLIVTDELVCNERHGVELFWHFAERCTVKCEGDVVTVVRGNVMLTMRTPQGLRCQVLQGWEAADPAGWISRSFDVRIPSPTVIMTGEISGTTRYVTELQIVVSG